MILALFLLSVFEKVIKQFFFSQDQEELSEFTTEKANEEMLDNVKLMTIKWSFIESLEPPKIVRVRTFPIITENNLYSQVTVRFHTKQVSYELYL